MFLVNRNGIPVHFYLRNTEIDKILTDSLSLWLAIIVLFYD
jgi:hypothetical protein